MSETGANEPTDASDAAAKLRSKNGVPKADLGSIDSQAQKIWAAARKGEVAPVIIARALTGKSDSKASGGTWATRIGALRLYNVVEKGTGNTLKLTALGVALSNTGDEGTHARALKEVLLGVPAYANVLTRFDGGSLPEASIIASEYEYAYELSKADAAAASKTFIESAKYAGFVSDVGVVSLGGLVAPAEESTPDETNVDSDTESLSARAEKTPPVIPTPAYTAPATLAAPAVQHVTIPPVQAPGVASGASPVGVTVKLDMSAWPVEDVLRVLGVLGYEGTPHESD